MAVGVGAGFDISKFTDALKKADTALTNLFDKQNQLSRVTMNAFKQMSEQGVVPYVESLKKQVNLFDSIKASITDASGKAIRGFGGMKTNIVNATNELNKLINALEKTKQFRGETSGKTAISYANKVLGSRGDKSIDNMRKALQQLEAAQNRQNLRTKTGQKNYENLAESIRRVKNELDKATGSSEKMNKSVGKIGESHKSLLDISGQLQRRLALVFSVSQITGYINKIVKVRGEFELQQRALQAIVQNVDEANKLWDKTVALAVKSPFRVKELVTYTKQLAAYRIETSKLYDTTKRLADVSAGLGVDMQRLILAYGQVKAANYLRGTELRQFSEAGINMLGELSKYFTEIENRAVSVADVFDRISKRGVSFEDVDAVFKRITGEGGVFYQMQEKQAETLKGQISNLNDSIDIMMNKIGKSNDSMLKGSISLLRSIMDNWENIAAVAVPLLEALIVKWGVYKTVMLRAKLIQEGFFVSMATNLRASMIYLTRGTKAFTAFGQAQGLAAKQMSNIKGNVWGMVIGAAVAAIVSFTGTLIEHRQALDSITKKYDELVGKIAGVSTAFRNASNNSDIKKQRTELQKLVDIANTDYHMKIKVDVTGMSASELANKFNELEQQVLELNAFSSSFAKKFQESTEFVVTDDIRQDFSQLSTAYSNLSTEIINKKNLVLAALIPVKDTLNEVQQAAVDSLNTPIGENETQLKYIERLKKSYETLRIEFQKQGSELYNLSRLYGETGDKYRKQHISLISFLKTAKLDDATWVNLFQNFDEKTKEARTEFNEFISAIDSDIEGLTKEEAEIKLKTAIDKLAAEEEWNKFIKTTVQRWTEEHYVKLGVRLVDEKDKKTEGQLKAWQESYNAMFGDNLITPDINESLYGFKKIQNAAAKQSEVIERLQGEYKSVKDLIDAINKAGGIKAIQKGGAYEGENLDELTTKLEQVQKQIEWFGAETKKEKDKNTEAKILKNRINLVEQLYKEYTKLNEKFGSKESEEQVRKAFSDTFKEAFEGTGINLSGLIVDKERLSELQQAGDDAGQAFSDAMIAKMDEVAERGTYIREFAKDTIDFITSNEGAPILRAKDVEGLGKGYTIGYGEYGEYKDTKKKIQAGDTITQQEAVERFTNVILPKYRDALNKILDANNDLIFTQEQYNALLDLTYQGGENAAKKLIQYAKNEAKGVEHINQIRKKYADTYGEEEAESKFGEAFVSKFKESESVYERMAMLLKTMNLTIGDIIRKDMPGMITRAEKRYSLFSGDLDIIEVLRKSAIDVSQIDFTNIEGVIAILKKLVPIAEKEGKEAQLTLSRAISDKEVEIGVKTKVEGDKELIDHIEKMFGNYEISLELEKLNIPSDLAKQLFNLDTLTLPELKDQVMKLEPQFVGTEMEEKYREFLEKIDDMEEKQQLERLKKYTQYLVKGQGERVKIKLEEMRQLAEIEGLNYNKQQKELIQQAIKEESKQKMDKLEWEDFKDSGMYVQLFEDLEYTSTKALEKMREKLLDLKTQLSDLDADDLKHLYSQIEKLDEQLAKRNPYKTLITGVDDYIIAVKKSKEIERELETQGELTEGMKKTEADLSVELSKEKSIYEQMSKSGKASREDLDSQKMKITALNSQLALIKAQLKAQGLLTDKLEQQLDAYKNTRKTFEGSLGDIGGDIADAANALPQLAEDMENIFGAMDAGTKDTVESIAEIGGGVGSAIQGFASGNYIQGILGVSQAISGIFKIGDKKKEREIQRQIELVGKLEKQYEKLEKQIEKAYTTVDLKSSFDQAQDNLDQQIEARKEMIAQEEAKKKTDKNRIKEWQNEIEELQEQQRELLQSTVEELGGTYDFKSATREFVDAWIDAFRETGNGLKGLEDNFDDFWKNIMLNQAVMGGASQIIEPLLKEVNKALETDFKVDDGEWSKIENEKDTAFQRLNDFMQGWFNQWGDTFSDDSGELSGLQRGIQGITEDQADVLASYLNSIRFYVSDNNSILTNLASSINTGGAFNPIVDQLKSILDQTTAINKLLDSVATNGGATAFNVRLLEE